MTKAKLIEILKKRIRLIEDWIDIEQFEDIASKILTLHEAEIAKLQERLDMQINVNDKLLLELKEANKQIAKYKELVKAWETLSDMQTDDFEQGTYYTNQITRNELRRKIAELESEVGK